MQLAKLAFLTFATFATVAVANPCHCDEDITPTPTPTPSPEECSTAAVTSTFQAPRPTIEPPSDYCTLGKFDCSGPHILQCQVIENSPQPDWGKWIVHYCAEGYACVPNDFECVALGDEWTRVSIQVNPTSAA